MTKRDLGIHAVAVAVAVLLLAVPKAGAQTWEPVGPPGGDVRSLALDPTHEGRVYLGTADGVLYRSDDGGKRWRRLTPGLPLRGRSVDNIAVDSKGIVYAGYWEVGGPGGGVAKSTDGGLTFTVLPGIDGESVRAVALSASRPNVVVAGSLTGVFRSDDGGRRWRRITPEGHPELRNIESLALDPGDPDVLYVGTWHLGWKTTDGGRTWNPVHAGMIDDSDVFTLTLDRRDPKTVYATACSGIYRSSDAGKRWTRIRGIPSSSRRTRSFAQDPESHDHLYAGTTEGLWASVDGGATWRALTQKALVVNSVVVLPGGVLLLGTDGAGVLRSEDGGRTWFASNTGFSERFVSKIVFDPEGSRTIVGVWGDRRHGGVFVALSPSGPWRRLALGLEGREVLALAVRGADVLAGTDDGIYVSTPTAREWARVGMDVAGIELHPRVTDIAVLSETSLLAATSEGLLRSLDGGRSWTRPRLGLGGQVYALAVSSRGTLLAATALGIFRSRDAGDTWRQVARGFGSFQVHTLAFLPGSETIAFAATPAGLFRSTDGARTWWQGGGLPVADITGLALHPDGQTAYASAFSTGGVFRSRDAGLTWERMPGDGLASERVWALAVDPAAPDRVYAAARAGGLHLLTPATTTTTAGAP